MRLYSRMWTKSTVNPSDGTVKYTDAEATLAAQLVLSVLLGLISVVLSAGVLSKRRKVRSRNQIGGSANRGHELGSSAEAQSDKATTKDGAGEPSDKTAKKSVGPDE